MSLPGMVNAYLPSIFTEAHCFEVRLNFYILFETILLYVLANLPNAQDPISMASCEAQQFFISFYSKIGLGLLNIH